MCAVFLSEKTRAIKGEQYPFNLLTFDVIIRGCTMLGTITAISKQE